MRKLLTIIALTISTIIFAQTDFYPLHQKAEQLLKAGKYFEGYSILKDIESRCAVEDTLYNYILWNFIVATTELEKQYRLKEQFEYSLQYGVEALKLIEKGAALDKQFAPKQYWMCKNLIVSYFGLGQLDKADEHKAILYKAYKDKRLPKGLDKNFNFSFFKWEGKNVWGYEWYRELQETEERESFSKIVYYVYSTNSDGTDKDQLFRLHVLKFHKLGSSPAFDYVLTKRLEAAAPDEVSGTLIDYTYDKHIDYAKLQSDIREVLKGNYEPSKATGNSER